MKDKVGEVYDGIITGVLQFGFFAQLRDLFVEGLVHVSSLTDDYYHYVEKLHTLKGEKRKNAYRIGDTVRVRVDKVDDVRKRAISRCQRSKLPRRKTAGSQRHIVGWAAHHAQRL